MKKYAHLHDYCRHDKNSKAKRLLQEDQDIDLTHADGIYFKLAVKHKNLEMLNILLDYYTKTKLQADDHDSMEYKVASFKLRNILQEAIDKFEVSGEMQKALDPYISIAEDTTDEELTDHENSEARDRSQWSHRSSEGEDSQHTSSILTEDLLKHFNQTYLDSSLHSLSAQPLVALNSDMSIIGNTDTSENEDFVA